MAGSLLSAWLLASSAFGCEDVNERVQFALEEVFEVNPDAARRQLDEAEAALACGDRLTGRDIARMFLVEAAVAQLERDPGAMADALASAHQVDPELWIDELGPKMRADYEAAAAAERGTAEIRVDAPGWEIWVDGALRDSPAEVPAGLHVVQVVDQGAVYAGARVWVVPGETYDFRPGLPARGPAPEAVVEASTPAPAASAWLYAGVGAAAAVGSALSGVTAAGERVAEPATKITVPVELGGVFRYKAVWARPAVGLAPLVGGHYLYAADGGAGASPFGILGSVAAGWTDRTWQVGGLAGVSYPGRIAARALAGRPIGATPLFVEARGGVNVGTSGRLEPAGGLAASVRLP